MSGDLRSGSVRRGRPLAFGAVALGLLLALPVLVRSTAGRQPEGRTLDAAVPLQGRLVYSTFESTGLFERRHRLWTLDLRTADLTRGPEVPPVEELFVVESEHGSLLLVTTDGGTGVAYLLEGLAPDVEPREVARGDVLALTGDRSAVLVGRVVRSADGCAGAGWEIAHVDLATLLERPVGAGCGRLLGLASTGDRVLISELREGVPVIHAAGSEEVLLSGSALVSASPSGELLVSDPEGGNVRALGVWPETPTGTLYLWDGTGRPEPLADGTRLFGERVVSWSPDGSAVVVSGIVGEERAMFLVRDGTRTMLLPPNSFPLRSAYSGASFTPDGAALAVSVGTVVVTSPTGVEPLSLPPDAPFPLGPVAWLP